MGTLHWPLEKQGSTGEDVRSVQHLLDARGDSIAVDGIYGPQTAAAITDFQKSDGLGVDGMVGGETWPELIVTVSQGSTGHAVRAVQSQIHDRSGWVAIDGTFGPETDSAVRSFQGDIGLAVDGIVGLHTWNALVSGYLSSHGGQEASDRLFQAWTRDDRKAAAKNATPAAVSALFTRPWSSYDGWNFDHCEGAAGHFYCTWHYAGGKLVLGGNDNTGAPFYFVDSVDFQP
jgi:peptidoglycan hydrolase-like protein with peptidoglycan-binding domain